MLLAGVDRLHILRKVFAKHPVDEEAMAWFTSDTEKQGVLGNVQISSTDDGGIQFFHLTLTHLSKNKSACQLCQNNICLSFSKLLQKNDFKISYYKFSMKCVCNES